MNSQFNIEDIHSGLLNKCGGKVKSWNKRWFVLRTDYCLYYYKDIAKGHLGVITLRDTQFKVRQGEAGDISWPKGTRLECAITMVTTNRTYYMHATSAEEANEWLRVLMETKKKLAESCIARKSISGSTTSTQSTQEDGSKENGSMQDGNKETDTTGVNGQHHNGEISENGTSPVNDGQGSESLYDVAKAPDDQPQSTQAETKPNVDETSKQQPQAIYDDVSFEESTKVSASEIKNGVIPPVTPSQKIYDQAMEDSPCVYDQVGPEPPSIQSQPLPPLPIARSISGTTRDGQAIYEDIPDNAQPLYEPIDSADGGNKFTRENAQEAEDSGGEEDTLPPPLLPPKDDVILPPLPPKDSQPPLPPKDDTLPPLPEKNTPPSPRRESDVPPLPEKNTPPSPRRESDVPPLPEKNTPPSPRKRTNVLPLPDEHSPPSPHRGSNERETPPRSPLSTPPKKPSPTPRKRKILPSPTEETVKVEGQDTSELQKGAQLSIIILSNTHTHNLTNTRTQPHTHTLNFTHTRTQPHKHTHRC